MQANLRGTHVYYETAGDGPPLVFVHGLGGTSNVWHAQRASLAKYFKVITLDLPGAGRSDKTERDYSMARWVEQLAELADQLQLDKFVLIGHSMTTILTQNFAAQHGSRLSAAVLCGPLTELTATGREHFTKRAELVQREGMKAVSDLVLGGALTPATREANPVLAGLYREMLLSHDPACYAGHCQALINGSAKADQPHIACPTLILLGDQDTVTPLSSSLAIASAIPNCRLRIVPSTAHLTMAERPEAFNAALLEFLASQA